MGNLAFEAVIFDMDGVITKTAITHAAAWKKMFDEYLLKRAEAKGETFEEFTQSDYLAFVDGKPRYKGVSSFLESRNINIEFGDPSDAPGMETVCGLGNRKNEAFNEVIARDGVEVYESTAQMLNDLKDAGIKLGVASSSKNCAPVLEAVDMLKMFGARVDGVVSAELGLHGKPEPDIFTTACDMLKSTPAKAIVVEDAVSGVQAGAKGQFGLTLGIARENNEKELAEGGADFVVTDLEEVGGILGLNELFLKNNK
ncbi:MAG: beta-phosphoglucomutase family hydrolase [Prolixibacteraceae bacterium]|nr:beta-phosphoglucomutase family hydrolase [Prolixibacteraceae bacterium]